MEQSVDRNASTREIFVVAADGTMLNMGNLPPGDTKRWVRRRKNYVVAAVKGGLLSLDDAYRRYSLTAEEFQGWESQVLLRAAAATRLYVSDNRIRARAPAATHRSNGHAPPLITTSDFRIDRDAKTVNVCGSRLDLTSTEFEMMQLLVTHKGQTITKEMFLTHLYGCAAARPRNRATA